MCNIWHEIIEEYKQKIVPILIGVVFMAILIALAIALSNMECEPSEIVNVERLADCIFRAENSVNHPYGIMKPYCTKNTVEKCRKGCIQTIEHALRDWDGKGDFIEFLGKRYAPIGVNNDPNNLNKNWIKNVRYYYEKRG